MINIRPILGWKEWVEFPELGIPPIEARISSAEKQSFLFPAHVAFSRRYSQNWISFKVHTVVNGKEKIVHCEAKVTDQYPTAGYTVSLRKHPVISTLVRIGKSALRANIVIIEGREMEPAALIGGNILRKRFFVDPGGSFLLKKDFG